MMRGRLCTHDGCETFLGKRNKSGLCGHHYQAARTINPNRKCAHCETVMRKASKTGLCAQCYANAQARVCDKCGCKFLNARKNSSGLCGVCHKTSPYIRQIPEDRIPDYYLLRQRGLTAQDAIEHINAGKPVARLRPQSAHVVPKVTTLEAVKIAGAAMQISPKDLLSDARFGHFVECRAVVVEAMRRQGVPYTQIGRRMGRDHSTIINLHRTFPKRAERNPSLLRVVDLILGAAA